MRRLLPWIVGALLCPALASAQSAGFTDEPRARGWVGIGLGGGSVTSLAPAPAADHDAFTASIDAGVRITPEWGLGIEWGAIAPNGGCGGHHCTPAQPDFAPDFTHWFLLAEYRPGGSGMRLRAGVGVSSMCYRYYKTHLSGWERFLDAALFDDDDFGDTSSWSCQSVDAFGASLSIGYQWALPNSPLSVGLQLRGEAANFAASSAADTRAFHHRALLMQVQLTLN